MTPTDAGLMPPGVRLVPVVPWRDGCAQPQDDWLAEEVPVALVINGLSHAVMMATPADLEDFALGFGLTEGLFNSAAELYGVDIEPVAGGIEVRMEVSSRAFMALKQRRRTMAGRTGCGLCGTDSLDQVHRALPTAPAVHLPVGALARAQRSLREWQAVQQLTGASHAAAWCELSGQALCVREDVGRHNALDKLIGAMTRARVDPTQGFIAITSRASFEMVQKAVLAGAGALAAVSAPTALAVDTARSCDLALAGFVRGDTFVAYTHAERFGLN